ARGGRRAARRPAEPRRRRPVRRRQGLRRLGRRVGSAQEATLTTKVGVLGAAGRMGSEACRAVEAADDLELVARLDLDDARDALTSAGAEVVVDFTRPDAVMDNLRWCVEHGLHGVVGTSGFDESRL